MIVKAREAHHQWCPFARSRVIGADYTEIPANRERLDGDTAGDQLFDYEHGCMASMCMAWRPVEESPIEQGYCGLAGTPLHLMERTKAER